MRMIATNKVCGGLDWSRVLQRIFLGRSQGELSSFDPFSLGGG